MVNAEPCSMGGIIDYGVGTKSSPRTLAIDNAQEELRQECDVREERRRELEFLEKGGNPLDFKFVHVTTVSVHSTSLTNRIVEHNGGLISEAKGSFATSPHRDSVESSDKPGSSLCRETNTADNLMLLRGNNNGIIEEKVVKRGTKRSNAAQTKQSLPADGQKNAKKADSSGLSRLGVKSQAYVRRNRSKPSRESANISSTRPSVTPAKGSEQKNEKGGTVQKKRANDHGVLSVSIMKQAGPKRDNAPKNTSDDQAAVELNQTQTIHGSDCVVQNEVKQCPDDTKPTEVQSNDASCYRLLAGCGEVAGEIASVENPDTDSKLVIRPCYSSASTHDERESCAGDEKADNMSHIHVGELDSIVPVRAVEVSNTHKNIVDAPLESTVNIADDHADKDISLSGMKIDGKSHEGQDSSRHSNKAMKESVQSECFSRPTSVKESSDPVQPGARNIRHMEDEMEVEDTGCTIVAQDTGCPSSVRNMNTEETPASDRNDSCFGDSSSAYPISAVTDLPPKNHLSDAISSPKNDESNMESEPKKSDENLNKMVKKAYEDSVLRNARVIEVTAKRAGERSLCNISLEKRRKGHWDFVLEEMAWMANDFMQERLWKSVVAAQVCHWVASDGRAKFEEARVKRKQKAIMKSIAKAIMSFWRSAETSQTADRTAIMMQENNPTLPEETKLSGIKAEKDHGNKTLEADEFRQPCQSQILGYAVRFLEYNSRTADSLLLAEAPPTPDRLNDFGILKVAGQLSEESLFYTVEPGAMLAYRESVESLFEYHKTIGNAELNDDYEASVCDSAADFPWEDAFEEDEGETCTYLSPEAYDGGILSKMSHKKKHLMHQRISGARQYEVRTDVPYEPCLESKSGNRPLLSNGKRPTSFLSIPAKRIRTAARQRVVSPFHAGASGLPQVTIKTDASSGDTNSYQDDESSLHGGSLPWRNSDFESTVDFDRQLPYNTGEVCTKGNKKKKLKNLGYKTAQNAANSCVPAAIKFQSRMYDQRLQVDSIMKYEQSFQKDYLKKRSEIQQYGSNGNNVANGGQHASKKLKMMKQGVDISHEASRVASQMSNMANPARFIKIVANRDRGRKCKALKMASSGGWSTFEDQALVVLVHDMGQNWELISDAINSIVQFKSVHRQPKECKERHKVLVDRSSGDGADSAEDSGSSQHYHNSLPGIPKGSARQLFERLQGPFEEENLKEHFEKIILLMRQVHSRRRQGNSQGLKPIIQPHSSHVIALSQACPNKSSEITLTPLDLCDGIISNLDAITPGSAYPGSHTNGLTLPSHQGSVGPATPTSNLNSRLPGSSGMVLGSNLPSPSTLNTPRDAQKYGVPRPTSLQGDGQPMIQYNQMFNGRNLQQPGGSVPGVFPVGADRGARMMPGGQMAGLSHGMAAAKAGFTTTSSPGVLNVASSGNLVPNSGQDLPGAVNVHPGVISGPGNPISRPRGPMQILRPGQSMEEDRQVPDFHMQVSQGCSQVVHFSSMNPSFSKVTASSPVQQPQQTHQMSQSLHMFGDPDHSQFQGTSASPQQRAYAARLAEERQFQQHMVPQQHSDLSASSVVPSVQGDSQILQQNRGVAVNPVTSSPPQHQRQQPAQNLKDNSSSPNQPVSTTVQKQKKQQGQQQSRQNQQQRSQGSQQAKLMKSLGRGNMLIPQPTPADSTPAIAVSTPLKKQVADKIIMQNGQGFPPANTAPTSSTLQPVNQPKVYVSLPSSPKQLPDIVNQSLMQGSSSQTLLAPQQPLLHSKSAVTTQQQQRLINPSQNNIPRTIMHQNSQMNSECSTDSHIDQVQQNRMVSTSVAQSTGSGSPVVSSLNQQKRGPSHVPKDTSFGNDKLLPSSCPEVLQRQFSDGFPTHGQGVAGQWNQQARQQLNSQNQHRPVVQGNGFGPSNPGPG